MVKKGKKLVLLDTHAILHRAYHSMPNFTSSKGEPTGALYGLALMILKVMADFNPDYIVAAYDLPEPTFRSEMYEDYKAGRAKVEDALVTQLDTSRTILGAFGIPVYEMAGYEADDVLGTIASDTAKAGERDELEVIIASGDMDTLSLCRFPHVKVYTLRKGINDTVIYDAKAVKERFSFGPEMISDYKALRGDPSDNIIGVKGIGEKGATELIQKFGSVESLYIILKDGRQKLLGAGIKERIVKLLEENEEEAFFSKELATIRTDVPLKFELPAKTLREGFDPEKAQQVLAHYEFKSLQERVKSAFKPERSDLQEEVRPLTEADSAIEPPKGDDVGKTGIALWLVNSDISDPSLENILKWAGTSDYITAKNKVFSELEARGLEGVYGNIEVPLIPIMRGAEERGVLIDSKYLKELSLEYHKELDKLEGEIYKEAGIEFNINSPKQMSEILFDKLKLPTKGIKKTKSGGYSTDVTVFEKLEGTHAIIDLLKEYRILQKLVSTYIDNIPGMLDEGNRLHTRFVQTGTATGRMSSRDPNLQNIPTRTNEGLRIRTAFVASPDYKLVSFDYSQIDLRAMAVLSRDPKLVEIFKGGGDIHTGVASEVFGVSPDDVDKDMRRRAKVINFGIIYGMGVSALKGQLGTSQAEAREFLDKYMEKFIGVAGYMEGTKVVAHKQGYTETLFGRRRYYPGINTGPEYMQKMAERMAVNAPVQGTSADIIKLATIAVDRLIKKNKWQDKVHLILQIHDELIYEVKEDILDVASGAIKSEMENLKGLKAQTDIPFPVNISIGQNWAEL